VRGFRNQKSFAVSFLVVAVASVVARFVTVVGLVQVVVAMVTGMAVVVMVGSEHHFAAGDDRRSGHRGIVGRIVDQRHIRNRFGSHNFRRISKGRHAFGHNLFRRIEIRVAVDEHAEAVQVAMMMVMTVVAGLAGLRMGVIPRMAGFGRMSVARMAFGFGSRAVQDQGHGNQQSGKRHGFGKAKHGQVSK
jgi:hypothetical protein